MKLRYVLATLAVAAVSTGMYAEETPVNLMADWANGTVNKYPGEGGAETNWVAYNFQGDQTGAGNGWQYRNATGAMNGSGPIGVLFLRWNDQTPCWYYGYKFTAIENHSYSLTLQAWVNDGKQTSLKVGACAAPINNSKNTPVQDFPIDPEAYATGSNINYPTAQGCPISYDFTATASGEYYVFFGALKSPNKPGNLIIATSQYKLVDNGEVVITADDYKALQTEAKALLANTDYVNVTGSERTALSDLANATETPADVPAAYKALNNAMNTFRNAKGDYDQFAAIKAKAQSDAVKALYEGASSTLIAAINTALGVAPATGAEAVAAIPAIKDSVTAAILGAVTGPGVKIDFPGAMMPADGVVPDCWQIIKYGTKDANSVRRMNNEYPDVWELFTNYYDTNEWGTSNWSVLMQQEMLLEPGNYTLAVAARSDDQEKTFRLFAGTKYVDLAAAGNSGNSLGRGWAFSKVNFSVAPGNNPEETKVPVLMGIDIAVPDHARSWFSFNNFILVKEDPVEQNEYKATLEEAQALLANEEYANVTGTERTALTDACVPVDQVTDYPAATQALKGAINAFKAAAPAYNAYVDLKSKAETDAVKNLYKDAAQSYLTEVEAGMAFTPQSADDALEAAATLEYAVREAIIGQVAGEGTVIEIEGGMMPEDGQLPGVWTKNGNGKVRMMNNEAPEVWNMFTEYFDTDNWSDKNWTVDMTQTICLQPDKKYTLVLAARSSQLEGQTFELYAGDAAKALPAAGNQDNTLGRGWALTGLQFTTAKAGENVSVPFGVRINVGDSDKHWFSFNDFRLVCNGNADESGVNGISIDNAAEAVYYDLNGVRVAGDSLTPGIYVVRQGGKTFKVIVK